MKCCIFAKYGKYSLTRDEWTCEVPSKPYIFRGLFFYRLCQMLSITLAGKLKICESVQALSYNYFKTATSKKLTNSSARLANKSADSYEFMDPHLKSISAHLKKPHVVASSEGM